MEDLGLNKLFGGIYAGSRVLVTGHTGFKGSWLSLWLQAMGAQVAGIALDPDTVPSHWALCGLRLDPDHRIDLRDRRPLCTAVAEFDPQFVFHLAAQPLVRRGYREPIETFETNVMGLVNLFEALRRCSSLRAVVIATTDKVYAPSNDPRPHVESDPLGGPDPYSASKACAEIVSSCYARSFFRHLESGRVPVATARAGNVIGGGDWAEDRLVPDLVRAVGEGRTLHLRNPGAVRPWQHVLEPVSGYLRLGQALSQDECTEGAWNFGPPASASLTVGEVVGSFQKYWPELEVVKAIGDHPHEAELLSLDSSKARSELGWEAVWKAERTIERTASWYRSWLHDGIAASLKDLESYVQDAAVARLGWTE